MGSEFNIEVYDQLIAEAIIEKSQALEKALSSGNSSDILKAQIYLDKQRKSSGQNDFKAFLFDPMSPVGNGNEYKDPYKKISFEVLKRMGKIHFAKMIKTTRINQIKDFLNFQTDENKEGFTVRRKIGIFEERSKTVSNEDKKTIENIVKTLENSRIPYINNDKSTLRFNPAKYDIFDNLEEFIQMTMNDSLDYDQLAFVKQYNRRMDLIGYKAIDASTIRLLNTTDPRYVNNNRYDEQFGFLPKYAQVWSTKIQYDQSNQPLVYYPWELGFGIRNKSTDVYQNGYGESELETLIQVMTWLMNGLEYNGNFFSNGSNPKGFINLKSGGGSQNSLNDFREIWRQTITGARNSHRIPVFEGIDLEWVDLQMSNKDMEFNIWLEFLLVMFCAVYTIDPSELGLNIKSQSQIFGQDGQKQRLEHSKNKGLKPLLVFLQKLITREIVEDLDPDFEFVFTGLNVEDESTIIDIDKKKLDAGVVSFEDMFLKHSKRKPTDKDTILNSVYQQAKMSAMYGGQDANQGVDESEGGEDVGAQNPFEQFESGKDENPIVNKALDFINKNFNIEK